MSRRTPSFLLCRNSIYYFHYRIPKSLKSCYNDKQFIRKSLKTSNYAEALHKARLSWLQVMTDKKITTEEIENKIEFQSALYNRGKELYETYKQLDPKQTSAVDWFFAEIIGADKHSKAFDQEALHYYQSKNQQSSQKQSRKKPYNPLDEEIYKIHVSELIERFIKARKNGWTKNTEKDYAPIHANIVELLGDPLLSDLNYKLIEEKFSNVIAEMPTHVSKKPVYKDKSGQRFSLLKCIEIAKKNNFPVISYRTLEKYVSQFKSLIAFGVSRKLLDKQLYVAFEFFDRIDHDPVIQNGSYTSDELKVIFYHEEVNSDKSMHKYPERYWILFLGLYTGARLNEIAQIKLSEIHKEDSFYYIDMLDEERTKRLKNKQSRRLIPIHPHLLELGFINYLDYQKSRKSDWLFSRLSKPDTLERYYRNFSNWYDKFRNSLKKDDLISQNRTFHDFRNTAINLEKQLFLNERVMREVFGHKLNKDDHRGYQNDYSIEAKYEEISKLTYDLDFKKIKKWKK